jgi:SAM-dependent methyltransferase
MINKTSKLLSFRYKKNFLLNRFKWNKLKLSLSEINVNSHDSCPICRCKEVYVISEVDRVGFPCETVLCKKCEFVFNNSFIDNPNEFYSHQWGDDQWGDPEKNFIKRTSSDSYSWKRVAFFLKKFEKDFSQINSVLEVGCGDGCNLLPYHLMGKSVTGCDFDSRFLEPGRKQGLNLIQGDIKNIPEDNIFDLIILIHSFEHVLDLDETINLVSKHLRPDGFVFLEVPGIIGWNQTRAASFQSMGLKSSNNFLNYLQFQHNYHFKLKHIKKVWERNGFEMTYGDEWVRVILRKKESFKLKVYNDHNLKDSSKKDSFYNTITHLNKVEKDFLKVSNITRGLVRLILRKSKIID